MTTNQRHRAVQTAAAVLAWLCLAGHAAHGHHYDCRNGHFCVNRTTYEHCAVEDGHTTPSGIQGQCPDGFVCDPVTRCRGLDSPPLTQETHDIIEQEVKRGKRPQVLGIFVDEKGLHNGGVVDAKGNINLGSKYIKVVVGAPTSDVVIHPKDIPVIVLSAQTSKYNYDSNEAYRRIQELFHDLRFLLDMQQRSGHYHVVMRNILQLMLQFKQRLQELAGLRTPYHSAIIEILMSLLQDEELEQFDGSLLAGMFVGESVQQQSNSFISYVHENIEDQIHQQLHEPRPNGAALFYVFQEGVRMQEQQYIMKTVTTTTTTYHLATASAQQSIHTGVGVGVGMGGYGHGHNHHGSSTGNHHGSSTGHHHGYMITGKHTHHKAPEPLVEHEEPVSDVSGGSPEEPHKPELIHPTESEDKSSVQIIELDPEPESESKHSYEIELEPSSESKSEISTKESFESVSEPSNEQTYETPVDVSEPISEEKPSHENGPGTELDLTDDFSGTTIESVEPEKPVPETYYFTDIPQEPFVEHHTKVHHDKHDTKHIEKHHEEHKEHHVYEHHERHINKEPSAELYIPSSSSSSSSEEPEEPEEPDVSVSTTSEEHPSTEEVVPEHSTEGCLIENHSSHGKIYVDGPPPPASNYHYSSTGFLYGGKSLISRFPLPSFRPPIMRLPALPYFMQSIRQSSYNFLNSGRYMNFGGCLCPRVRY